MATLTPPTRSVAQRTLALDVANETRFARARLKRKIAGLDRSTAQILVAGLLVNPPRSLDSMRLAELLRSLPRWGDVKVETVLRRLDVSPRKKVGDLSLRQRRLVVEALARSLA